LDGLPLDAAEFERTANEAVIAFALNREVFHQLGEAHPAVR
jgi:heme oxygenase